AMLAEQEPQLADGTVAVVGEDPDHDRDTARTVSLVIDLLERLALQLSASLLHGAIAGVVRQTGGPRGEHGRAQTRIGIGIAAVSRGDGDLLDQLGEQLAALGVLRSLLVLDGRPFGMTGHDDPPLPGGVQTYHNHLLAASSLRAKPATTTRPARRRPQPPSLRRFR